MMPVLFSHDSDLWETPISLYNELNSEFHFTLDPCALPSNAKCEKFFTPEINGLLMSWKNEIVFCNPPYSDCKSWVEKAYNEWLDNDTLVVLLLPARTDTKWFHDFIYKVTEIRFIKGRLKFSNSSNNAPFPSMICIFRPCMAEMALI